jgi:hypothetical protein
MKTDPLLAPAILALLSLASVEVAIPQSAPSTPPPSSGQTNPVPPPAGAQGQALAPGLDDLMTMLIQPRHIKLYYAGIQNTWELAAAESHDLRSSFGRIAQTVPTYLNYNVAEAITALITPKMQALDAAIAAGDARQFARAYSDLTSACNACHAYLEHPFLVIKVPDPSDHSSYADQVFSPIPGP